MMSGPVLQIAQTLLATLPYTLVLIGAIVLALINARHMSADPRPAVFLAVGASLLLFNVTAISFLRNWWLTSFSGGNANSVYWMMSLISFLQSLVSAIGVGLLSAGCLIGRRKPQ